RPTPPQGEGPGGPPGDPEGAAPDRPDQESAPGAGAPDRGGTARGAPPAPAPRDRAARGHRGPEEPGGGPEPQADRARVAQEAGGLREQPLHGAPPEAQRDEHRLFDPEQQRAPAGPGGGPLHSLHPPEAQDCPRGDPDRTGPGSGLRAP